MLIAQRKAAREEAALYKNVEREEKKRLRKEAIESRAADRQLELDIRKVCKHLQNSRVRSKQRKEEEIAGNQGQEAEGRYGRQLRSIKQFDS